MKRIGTDVGHLPAVICGHMTHSDTPGIVKHKRSVDKEHDDGNVGLLVAPEQRQRRGPVIVDQLDVLTQNLFKTQLLGLGSEDEFRVSVMHPFTPVSWEPKHLGVGETGERGARGQERGGQGGRMKR